jgi:hypothetical protein
MRSLLLLCLTVLVLAACSPALNPPAGSSGIEGQVFIGPTCPVMQIGQSCPDRPYQATLSVLNAQGKRVSRFQTDADGRFKITLAPGIYTLKPEAPNAMQRAPEQTFTVLPGEFTRLAVTYDSGIR